MAATAAATSSYHHSSSNHLERAGPIPIRARPNVRSKTIARLPYGISRVARIILDSRFWILDHGSAARTRGQVVQWVGSACSQGTPGPCSLRGARRLSGCGRALRPGRLAANAGGPARRRLGRNVHAVPGHRGIDTRGKLRRGQSAAVGQVLTAPCQVFFDLGMIPPRSRSRVASESSPLRSPLCGSHSLLLSTKSHPLSSPFIRAGSLIAAGL